MKPVLLVSAREAIALDADLMPLQAALEKHGIPSIIVAWDDPAAPWSDAALAVVRSAWDYVPRRNEFLAWARALPCPLANTAEVLAWNTDKRYLRHLEAQGVTIVPTQWIEPDAPDAALPALTGEVVVKPAISAGAKDSARFTPDQHGAYAALVQAIKASGRTVMIQPYQASVDRRGETGMLFFDGELSHAIQKGAILRGEKKDVGGLFAEEKILVREPTPREHEFGKSVLAALPFPMPLYARVDVVEDEQGNPQVLELELTEPSTFLDVVPAGADRFAAAIERRLRS